MSMTPVDQMVQKLVANITAAGPDSYDRATTNTADAKRALLQAVADGGTAGRAEYERQAAQSQASRSTALQAALAAAAGRGAPQATQDAVAAQISRPYDEASSARDAASANWQNYFNAMGTADGAYLDRVAAAIPQQQQQARNSLAIGLNHDYQTAQGQELSAKDQLALQLAQTQAQMQQRWADQQIAASNLKTEQQRQDAQRAEDWQHQLYLAGARGGGGSSGGGSGGRKSSGGGGSAKAAKPAKTGLALPEGDLNTIIGGAANDLGPAQYAPSSTSFAGIDQLLGLFDNTIANGRLGYVANQSGLSPGQAQFKANNLTVGQDADGNAVTAGQVIFGAPPARKAPATLPKVAAPPKSAPVRFS